MDAKLSFVLAVFKEFLDSLPQPVAVVDADGNYVYYNERSAEQDDYAAMDALGNPLLQVYPKMTASTSTLLQSAFTGKRYYDQYQLYYNACSKPVHQIHTTLPLFGDSGQIIGAIEIARDLSVAHRPHEQANGLHRQRHAKLPDTNSGIVTCDPAMQQIVQQAQRLAKTDVPVLIYGETGTGKELFAHLLHTQSERAKKPFLVMNCAAIPETLFESALFGVVKGAYTGAENRPGLIESAQGGALFLDELNSLPMIVQGKLLRVLQERTFRRIGSTVECHVDVRIIAATNESPQEMLQQQRIRPDLLYRLDVGHLTIPPLRERKRDIPLLAQAFLERHGRLTNNRVKRINPAVLDRLQAHSWPGNVRMLENIILRSLIFCEKGEELDFVLIEDDNSQAARTTPQSGYARKTTPLASPPDMAGMSLEAQVAAYERDLLLRYLKRYPNLSEAARQCGLPRATLQYRMKKHGIRLEAQVIDD